MDNIKTTNFLKKYIINRTTFKILMIIATMITTVPYLHMKVGGYVKIILLLGLIILGCEIKNKNLSYLFKDNLNKLLFAFCCSYLITIVINRDANLVSNLKALVYMFIFFALFFMFNKGITIDKMIKEIKTVSLIIICCTFILSLVSFLSYILSINGYYQTANSIMYYGMFENRLWGVYNPNTGSMLNCISIILSLTFIVEHYKKKILYIINILFQFSCLVLTGSRSSLYALFLIVGIYIFCMCKKNIKKDSYKSFLICFLISIVTVGAVIGLSKIAKEGLSYLPSITKSIKQSCCDNSDSIKHDKNKVDIEKYNLTRMEKIEQRDGGVLTGRVDLWKAGLKTFSTAPIFGVGRENIYKYTQEYLNGGKWSNSLEVGGLHNIYLTILVSSGIVGFIILAIFALISIIKTLKVIFKNCSSIDSWFITSFIITIMFFITEFVEARILYQVSIFNVLFWIYCGYMSKFSDLYMKKQLTE